MKADSALLQFYRLAGADHRGRTLVAIRAWDDEKLESRHDFIQWLFPLPEPSGANPQAPLLQAGDIAAFHDEAPLRDELIRSLATMLAFYGLQLAGTADEPRVERGARYAERSADWLERSHNFLRVSRILRSLSLLGCGAHARAFLDCLAGIYAEHRDRIGSDTWTYWERAVR